MAVILVPLQKVSAHSVELDPDSKISFPMIISQNKGTIRVYDVEDGYKLYYQAVEIQDNVYSQIETIQEDGEKELDNMESEINSLKSEYENSREAYNNAYDAYMEKVQSGEDDEELKTLKEIYDKAKADYTDKATAYNAKVKEYNTKVNEINGKINELIPTYIEKNWVETKDGNFTIDTSNFSGQKAFAVWAKLVESDGTITYDESTYSTSGSKAEGEKVKGVSLDKSVLQLKC